MADTKITDLTSYTPPGDTDVLPIVDISSSTTKKITWANIKATLKTYFDGLYEALGAVATHAALTATHGATGAVVGTTNAQTLTNKTLTSPGINGGTATGVLISLPGISGGTASGILISLSGINGGTAVGLLLSLCGINGGTANGLFLQSSGISGGTATGVLISLSGISGGTASGVLISGSGISGGTASGVLISASGINGGTAQGIKLLAPSFGEQAIGSAFTEKVIALAAGTPIAIDTTLGNIFTYSFGSNISLGTPTGTLHGKKIILFLKATGTATATATSGVANGFAFGSDVTALTQTTNGSTDVIGLIYNNVIDRWMVVAYSKGYS